MGRDDGLNATDAKKAEDRVAEWREKGELPFPHFPDDVRSEVWNSLDWPPEGSPAASRG